MQNVPHRSCEVSEFGVELAMSESASVWLVSTKTQSGGWLKEFLLDECEGVPERSIC